MSIILNNNIRILPNGKLRKKRKVNKQFSTRLEVAKEKQLIRKFSPPMTMKEIYHTFIVPKLESGGYNNTKIA